jgi:hypothetical protein
VSPSSSRASPRPSSPPVSRIPATPPPAVPPLPPLDDIARIYSLQWLERKRQGPIRKEINLQIYIQIAGSCKLHQKSQKNHKNANSIFCDPYDQEKRFYRGNFQIYV